MSGFAVKPASARLIAVCLGLMMAWSTQPSVAQDARHVALEIDRFARVCLGTTASDARNIKLLSVSAEEADRVAQSHAARSFVAALEGELSRFDSIAVIDARVFGAALDKIWDIWRKQSNLLALSWEQISVDIVLMTQGSPLSDRRDGLRFIVHNPRSGCTKYVGPVPLTTSASPPEPRPQPPPPAPVPTPTPLPMPPACGWYAIAFCRPHGNEAEVHQWNAQNARAQVIDTNSTAYPNFTRGWFCVVSGPHDKAVATGIETRWKANGWKKSYIKNACK